MDRGVCIPHRLSEGGVRYTKYALLMVKATANPKVAYSTAVHKVMQVVSTKRWWSTSEAALRSLDGEDRLRLVGDSAPNASSAPHIT